MIFQNIDTYESDLPEDVRECRLMEQKKKLFGQLAECMKDGDRYEVILMVNDSYGGDFNTRMKTVTILTRDLSKKE